MKLLDAMADGCLEWDNFICNATISACKKASKWLRAMELLADMAFGRGEQDTIMYIAAINDGAKGSVWFPVMDLLIKMAGGCVEWNPITRNAALSVCETAQVWFRAVELMAQQQMCQRCLQQRRQWQGLLQQRQQQRRSAAGSNCEKGGKWKPADSVRDTVTFNAAVSAMLSQGRAHWDTITYNAAFGDCTIGVFVFTRFGPWASWLAATRVGAFLRTLQRSALARRMMAVWSGIPLRTVQQSVLARFAG